MQEKFVTFMNENNKINIKVILLIIIEVYSILQNKISKLIQN